MILTVTLNPLLEKRFTYKKVRCDEENRNGKESFNAGGKGINVSRQLNYLQSKNLAFTFSGGNNGKILKNILTAEGIQFTSVQTKNETRFASVIISEEDKTISTFFGINSIILEEEAHQFLLKLEKMIQNCEMVIFSGSSPCSTTDSIIPIGIEIANKYDKISLCDTYGNHLSECLKKCPTIIHNNVKEVEQSLNVSLTSEKEKIEFLKQLYSHNIKQVFLTDGGNPAYASTMDYFYKIEIPAIHLFDSTGSGDAFTAGAAYSFINSFTFEETLRFASSLGIANAESNEVCAVPISKVDEYKYRVTISSVGKKMKLIDVTPQ